MAVYLLHFDTPYRHARHYLGWTDDVARRVEEHRAGRGARLTEVIKQAGITFRLARVWVDGDRRLEKRLKAWHKSRELCPICQASNKTDERGK